MYTKWGECKAVSPTSYSIAVVVIPGWPDQSKYACIQSGLSYRGGSVERTLQSEEYLRRLELGSIVRRAKCGGRMRGPGVVSLQRLGGGEGGTKIEPGFGSFEYLRWVHPGLRV